MPTARPRYTGGERSGAPREFPAGLRHELSELCSTALSLEVPTPSRDGEGDVLARADQLAASILTETRWAAAELHWQRSDVTKPELRAEQADLRKALNRACEKLRRLSPGLDRLLGVDADPLGCADSLQALLVHVDRALAGIDGLPLADRPDEKQHAVVVELAIRVLRVLKNYGLRPTATVDPDFGYVSLTVEVLELLGEALGLYFARVTWRDVILDAYRSAPDVQ